jgi:TRAP-type C4-dicarboxylate transport system substrate-binding protein
LATTVAFVGCGGAIGNKGGGPGDPVLLRLANPDGSMDYAPAAQYFIDRLQQLSSGNIKVLSELRWGNLAPDAEQQVLRAVAMGDVDLAIQIGPRDLATAGLAKFRAFQAPLLIESNTLEKAVFKEGIIEGTLTDLNEIGVVALAAFAQRSSAKPIAASRPLLGPDQYRGITFYTYPSHDYAAAIKALGARPTDQNRDAGVREGRIQGFAQALDAYTINHAEAFAPYVTINVNLFSGFGLLLANPRRLARLSPQQRAWIRQAAEEASARSLKLITEDDEYVAQLCGSGTRFAIASAVNLAGLRHAFDPIYADLERNAQMKTIIEKIEALKRSTRPDPVPGIPVKCAWRSASTRGS